MRVYDLARELRISNNQCLDLCKSLGIGVRATSSSMDEAHAYRVRKLAERENLIGSEAPAEEPAPAAAPPPPAAPARGSAARRAACSPQAGAGSPACPAARRRARAGGSSSARSCEARSWRAPAKTRHAAR